GLYSHNDKNYNARDGRVFTVEVDDLVAIVDASQRTTPVDSQISIDASSSSDPNFASGRVIHSWSCMNLTAVPASKSTSCDLPPSINYRAPIL
ncbi:hypothetical protein PFISCL1PPCAC_26136, partial [Pristionchus fissidentatus]